GRGCPCPGFTQVPDRPSPKRHAMSAARRSLIICKMVAPAATGSPWRSVLAFPGGEGVIDPPLDPPIVRAPFPRKAAVQGHFTIPVRDLEAGPREYEFS